MSNKKAFALFATPLLKFTQPDAETLNADLWRDACALRAAAADIQGDSNPNQRGWRPGNFLNYSEWRSNREIFKLQERSFQTLRSWIKDCAIEASRQFWEKSNSNRYKISMDAWININGKDSLNGPHSHAGSHWSAVYYVKVPDSGKDSKSGAIEFLDPRGNISGSCLPNALTFGPKHTLMPVPGELILFPSYLMHWVHPNKSDEERMSIAVNIRLDTTPEGPSTHSNRPATDPS